MSFGGPLYRQYLQAKAWIEYKHYIGTEPTPFCFPAVRSEFPLSMKQLIRNIQETNSKVIVN